MNDFMSKFHFDPRKAGYLGVERECFLANGTGRILPIAPKVLAALPVGNRFGYELSACQLEERTGPCPNLSAVLDQFDRNEEAMWKAEEQVGFSRLYREVAPEDMPLDVYPDPTGRYQQITANMPIERLRSACRVAAVHIHVGMPDHETALRVYNSVVPYTGKLILAGNRSRGERHRIYQGMAPNWMPVMHHNWQAFEAYAQRHGFHEDPRQCWHLIRISVHGTIEFRMFDTTHCLHTIKQWAAQCYTLCEDELTR